MESFGNFEGVGISEILGIFNLDLFLLFYEIFLYKNQVNLFGTNTNALALHYFFWQFTGLYGSIIYRKNHKSLL